MSPDLPRDTLESDDRFPSGPWFGYYQQGGLQSRQRMALSFAAGCISGIGHDPGGDFAIRGRYDTESGRVTIHKTYPGHTVEYDGLADGDGIGGAWVIRYVMGLSDRGVFRIWPHELEMQNAERLEAREPVLAQAR